MAGPLVAVRFVHNAIRREVAELETAIADLDASNPDPFALLAERFATLGGFLQDHEHAEEAVIFPALEERAPHVVRAYEIDHRSNDELMDQLSRGFERLARAGSAAEAAGVVREVYAHSVALRATMNLHLLKEEQHLLVVAEQLFDLPEQGALMGRISAASPPERMPQALAWMFQRLSVDDREGILRIMQMGAPPQAFQGLTRLLAEILPAEEWAELRRRLPNLEGAEPAPA